MAVPLFITGTGTGVGKTLITALLTLHLRRQGIHAIALKPYCSGSWDDTDLLIRANGGGLQRSQVTAVYCREPLAPYAALGVRDSLRCVTDAIELVKDWEMNCDVLIVEGAGGVAVPLAPHYTMASFLTELGALPLVVGCNRLGILSEVQVCHSFLDQCKRGAVGILLMGTEAPDESAVSNAGILKEVLAIPALFQLPFLGLGLENIEVLKRQEKKQRKTLARVAEWYNVSSSSSSGTEQITAPKNADLSEG